MNDITIRRPINWLSHSDTNVGMVREINEDSILSRPEIGLWVVADGMGGHEGGNVASDMIIKSLGEVEKFTRLSDFVSDVEDKVIDVNYRLLEYAEIMLDGRIIGSTFITLLIHGQVGVCLWAGDSRLYRYRNNKLTQISCDHSHVSELVQQGAISREEAENHPDANVITRAVGTSEDFYVDVDIFPVNLGDVFLLCSDGLYNAVDYNTICEHLENDNVEDAVNNLINAALENGAPDNVSTIVIKGIPQVSGEIVDDKLEEDTTLRRNAANTTDENADDNCETVNNDENAPAPDDTDNQESA